MSEKIEINTNAGWLPAERLTLGGVEYIASVPPGGWVALHRVQYLKPDKVRNVAPAVDATPPGWFKPDNAPHAIAPGTVTKTRGGQLSRWHAVNRADGWRVSRSAWTQEDPEWLTGERVATADELRDSGIPLADLLPDIAAEVATLREAKAGAGVDWSRPCEGVELFIPMPRNPNGRDMLYVTVDGTIVDSWNREGECQWFYNNPTPAVLPASAVRFDGTLDAKQVAELERVRDLVRGARTPAPQPWHAGITSENAEPWTFETMPVAVKVRRKRDDEPMVAELNGHLGICVRVRSALITFEELLRDYQQIDGSPCGTIRKPA